MRSGTPGVAEPGEWLAATLAPGSRVGIDPWCHTSAAATALATALADAGVALVPLAEDGNLVDTVWARARPPPPSAPVRVHPAVWAGESVPDKLARLREAAAAAGAGGVVATALDEVAWLFNLRGGDVEFNPVFRSYALITADTATLYVDAERLTAAAAAALAEAGVSTAPYARVAADVAAAAAAGVRLWADPTKVSHALTVAARDAWAPGGKKRRRAAAAAKGGVAPAPAKPLVEKPSPITAFKAIKNAAELAGMDEAHARDGVALATALAWVDAQAAAGNPVNEVAVDEIFTGARAAQEGFIEPSFPTIAGADANGAVIHYRAEPGTAATATASSLLLIDSGGQYECGTTDVTRTVHLGAPPAAVRDAFTRVLRGHIALSTCVFPEGTPGLAIDALARVPLWAAGLNYRHGTGHGVGAALCVHEGPHSISTRLHVHTPLEEGMIVSIEPGYYEEGAFGIRIENLVAIERADTPHNFGGSKFFRFRPLTLAPLQAKLIDVAALSDGEAAWVDAYHGTVWDTVSPRVADPAVREWLRAATAPLPRA